MHFAPRTALALLITGLLMISSAAASEPADLDQTIHQLQQRWAQIKYETPEKEQAAAFEALAQTASQVSGRYTGRAEPLIWEGIILSTYAGAKGGLGALKLVKAARDRLLQAETIDPTALDGSVYTSLGSLYYQVPGWPLGFGDHKKARGYLEKALQVNPTGIDPNYFYGDFLMEEGDYAKAADALEKALAALPRAGREVADHGRKEEIRAALEKARKHL